MCNRNSLGAGVVCTLALVSELALSPFVLGKRSLRERERGRPLLGGGGGGKEGEALLLHIRLLSLVIGWVIFQPMLREFG